MSKVSRNNTSDENITIFIVLSISLAITATYFIYDFYDSYVYTSISLSNIIINEGVLSVNPINRSGFVEGDINLKSTLPISHILIAILSHIISLPCNYIIFYPVTSFIELLSLILVFKLLFNNKDSAFCIKNKAINILSQLFLVIVGVIITTGPVIAGPIYYISLGYSFYFIYMYLIIKVIEQNKLSKGILIFLTLIVLIASQTYYTSIFLITSSSASLLLFLILKYIKNYETNISSLLIIKKMLYLLILSLISIFTFTEPIYKVLTQMEKQNLLDAFTITLQNFLQKSLALISGEEVIYTYKPIKTYNYLYYYNTLYNVYLFSLVLSTLIAFMLLFIIYWTYRLQRNQSLYKSFKLFLIICYITLLNALWHIAAYFAYGQATYALLWLIIAILVAGAASFLNMYMQLISQNLRRLTNYGCRILVILILITISVGVACRVLYVTDHYYANYYSFAKGSIVPFLMEFTTPKMYILLNHKLYFLTVSKYLESNTDIDLMPILLLASPETTKLSLLEHDIHYIEYFAPFEYIGVAGIIPKEMILNWAFGSTHKAYLNRLYDNSIFTIIV